jgi:hypothetical protein
MRENQRFSDRMGISRRCETLQLDDINADLRVALWNLVHESIELLQSQHSGLVGSGHYWHEAAQSVAMQVVNAPVDDIPYPWDWLKDLILSRDWFVVYDVVEFLASSQYLERGLGRRLNVVLEREGSGYRLVAGELVPITSEAEIDAIENAISAAGGAALGGAREHIAAALEAFSNKPEADYRNSIKESISAVESAAKRISGVERGGLNDAFAELARLVPMHAALIKGFKALYGYTSDEDGIRHAILEEPNVGYDEAKFMLVACSAFVNFLISKASAAGLLESGR